MSNVVDLPCSRCGKNPRIKNRYHCRPCRTAEERERRHRRKFLVKGQCRCGKPVMEGAYVCVDCAAANGRKGGKGHRKINDTVPRCQAARCELPVRGDSRMCGIHLPRFEFLDVPTLEEAATMGWGTWIV